MTTSSASSNANNKNNMSDAEAAVVAALEAKQEHDEFNRVAHLPFLVRKMRASRRQRLSASKHNVFSDSQAFREVADSCRTSSTRTQRSKSSSDKRESSALPSTISKQSTSTITVEQTMKATPLAEPTKTDKDAFLDNAIHLEALMEETDDFSFSSVEEEEEDALDSEATTLLPQGKKKRKKKQKKHCIVRRWNHLILLMEPDKIQENILQFLQVDLGMIMFPLLVAAFTLFYVLGNPDLEMLPNTATLAWYLLFVVRLHCTFTLARCTHWLLRLATIRTGFLAKWSGPLVAIFAMQSLGWPFLLASFGAWNSVLLHGSHSFCKHWLYFTNMAIFTVEHNPDGDGILQSELYARILFAMIFVGLASAIKRTTVALFLSKRMLQNYKPQLEVLMYDVKLITGLAELAAETERPGFAELIVEAAEDDQSVATTASQIHQLSSSDFMQSVPTFQDSDEGRNNGLGSTTIRPLGDMTTTTSQERQEQWQELKADLVAEDKATTGVSTQLDSADKTATLPTLVQGHNPSVSTFEKVFSSLDRYEPPEDQEAKQESPSLSDILQFRKAMNFMRLGYPFSPLFGRADTRERCVESAIRVYQNLQKFLPPDNSSAMNEDQLSFDVIGAIAYSEDGTLDKARAQGLLRLFLPDKDNQVSLHSFVQALDSVYKQILFLSASMSNTSKIDSVLEDGFNVAFYAVLSIMVLSLVGWNPWPLLASFGTMLLSLTFALGPSCAKTIEGILAIAVRRPFDLGDRISLTTASAGSSPSHSDTWIVEDINLMTTTLRYAATNEVSTINNSSLSGAQIVNCARSPKALVRFRVAFRVDATPNQLQTFRARLVAYLQDNPQTWAGLIQFANDGIQRDDGYIIYMIGVQHVKSWQDMGKIVSNRGELEVEVDRIAQDLEIHYESPTGQMSVELVDKKTDVC